MMTKLKKSRQVLESPVIKAKLTSQDKAEAEPKAMLKEKNQDMATETGGPKGLEPTRYGDWESKGRCIDF